MNMNSEKDMIEVNLGKSHMENIFCNDYKLENTGFPYGYKSSDTNNNGDDDDDDGQQVYFYSKSHSTGQLAKKEKKSDTKKTVRISCLSQMYCPECHQRLHDECVYLERFIRFCCFPKFPIFPCCMKRSESCKVICGKCGFYLGSWKQQ